MDESANVVSLGSIRPGDLGRVGAKAFNLARMLGIGLPVPEGFCVTVAAYRQHLGPSGLSDRVRESQARLGSATGGEKRQLLADLRRAITEAELPQPVAAEIRRAFDRLGSVAVAVRSSGTAEDLPEHSFAGLYDTYLVRTDAAGCAALVKGCWASLWTERACEYREKNRIDHAAAGMAVVVQRLVAADAAGVAFTADPVVGRRDRVIVESCWGLGEALVSGKVSPDRFVLDRKGLDIVDRSVSHKSLESLLSPAGVSVEQAVPLDRADAPSIDDETARKVARLALRAEQLFRTPQDVEWALAGHRLFLLQARPITTRAQAKSREDRQVWSNSNTAEVLPGVLSPLVWSIVGESVIALLGGVVARLGISFGEHPFIGEVAGRVYTNLNTFTGMVRRMPFASRMNQARMFGGAALKPEDRVKLELDPEDVPDIKLSPLKTVLKLPGFLFWILKHGTRRGRQWMAQAHAAYAGSRFPDLSRLSEGDLLALERDTMAQMRVGGEGIGYALTGMMYTSVLYDLCRRWLDDPHGTLASRLLAGTGDLQSAEAGLEMWRIARAAAAVPALRAAVESGRPWEEVRAALALAPAGQEFLDRWDKFMFWHGHHARGEMDLMQPRWAETPDYVLEMVRSYAGAEGHDPEADIERRAREGEQLQAELRARLRNPIKRAVFGHVVVQAQRSAAIRENIKDAAIRVFARTRLIVVELGRRFAARAALAAPDDIFFLRNEELGSVAAKDPGFDARRIVLERRAEYERNLALTPPAIVVGRYDPKTHPPDEYDPDARVLSGLAVSPGKVVGRARVILLADASARVEPGEILVAPFTDPGWTPYFIPAAGIVMDQGGLLSHGSIVAREYGIPAVVNVGPATKIIKTGQMVEVDGDNGVVRILTTAI
jgi:phosphohistidine swiveling domain-containing protein